MKNYSINPSIITGETLESYEALLYLIDNGILTREVFHQPTLGRKELLDKVYILYAFDVLLETSRPKLTMSLTEVLSRRLSEPDHVSERILDKYTLDEGELEDYDRDFPLNHFINQGWIIESTKITIELNKFQGYILKDILQDFLDDLANSDTSRQTDLANALILELKTKLDPKEPKKV